jgi:hypothetical protein
MTRWDRSDDPIPEGCIRRSELFESYYRMVTPNCEDLGKAIEAAYARRGSAENAPKLSAWKPAADGPLSKTEEDKFLGTRIAIAAKEIFLQISRPLSETERAFWKAEKAFYAATKAQDAARADAAKKFIAALAAGELRPMLRRRGSNQVLSPNMWDKDDVIPLLLGLDGIIGRDRRTRPVFFNAGESQDWLAKQGTAATNAAPKVGPDGGRPSSMYAVEAKLAQLIKDERVEDEVRRLTSDEKGNAIGLTRLDRTLGKCCEVNPLTIGRARLKPKNKSLSDLYAIALKRKK